jgi:hypothetical protein
MKLGMINYNQVNSCLKFYLGMLILVVFLSSCTSKTSAKALYDTELNCPQFHYRVVLLEVSPGDLRRSIDWALKEKGKFKTTENYTVLKLPNKKNFFIPDIPTEALQYCYLIAIPINR